MKTGLPPPGQRSLYRKYAMKKRSVNQEHGNVKVRIRIFSDGSIGEQCPWAQGLSVKNGQVFVNRRLALKKQAVDAENRCIFRLRKRIVCFFYRQKIVVNENLGFKTESFMLFSGYL